MKPTSPRHHKMDENGIFVHHRTRVVIILQTIGDIFSFIFTPAFLSDDRRTAALGKLSHSFQQLQIVFLPPHQSRCHGMALVGLAPPNKAPQASPIKNVKHFKSMELLSSL